MIIVTSIIEFSEHKIKQKEKFFSIQDIAQTYK